MMIDQGVRAAFSFAVAVSSVVCPALGLAVLALLVTRMLSPAALSRREIEVLALVSVGRTNAEIGPALLISEATVKTHLVRAFGKLGVGDRAAP